ncbi:response regulator transcription factor [Aliikangiella marina]|uniref:Response regulator transcription factor n=1 Tax=Aliikangiella marina TaxID=1712262 RepID=A0A545THV6_9GAMM|nr:response regulator transcription factor [Aliikangiella marina]TQV76788.1 response regulator transcription factor [Aliikangiella marina]
MKNEISVNKIIIADDHPLFRNALVQALKSEIESAAFFEAASITELEQVLADHSDVDLLLMDLHMPGANGFVGLSHVVQRYSQLPVVMISANEDIAIAAKARQYGALGFVPKSASIPHMIQAIESVLMGDESFPDNAANIELSEDQELDELVKKVAELTPKQLEVFNLLSDGLLNKQVAYEQNVTEATVKAHVTAIMRKLGVTNRTQVILIANKIKVDENFGSPAS